MSHSLVRHQPVEYFRVMPFRRRVNLNFWVFQKFLATPKQSLLDKGWDNTQSAARFQALFSKILKNISFLLTPYNAEGVETVALFL